MSAIRFECGLSPAYASQILGSLENAEVTFRFTDNGAQVPSRASHA